MADPSPALRNRDASIDVLRGLVMCLMVLDHARDFSTSTHFNPTDPDQTNVALFFTRWATHFCAPVFMLLAGAGAGISSARGKDTRALSRFLFTRGLWLVFLELTFVRFGWFFDLSYRFGAAQVIWALGWCMVLLAGLVWLPSRLLGVVAGGLVVGHNLLDPIKTEQWGQAGWLWKVLHAGGPLEIVDGHVLFIAYPLVPWVGVMALGYLMGRSWPSFDRRRLVGLGAACMVGFVALRFAGVYGDPHPYVARAGVRSLFAFLDCEKYPPSLEYLLMTLGPALLVLGLMRGRELGLPGRIFVAYGRAPLIFYLLHLPLVHGMTIPFRAARGLPLATGPFRHGLDLPLSTVYAMWIAALVLLWWPTARWARLKAERKDAWLSYL